MFFGIAGEVRAVVTDAQGDVKIDTGFQKNLILDQGLEFFGGNKGGAINASCAIGSGNSAPAVTQTALDAFVSIVSGSGTTDSYAYADDGSGLYKMWEEKKYRFEGLSNVNVAEVGLVSQGSASTNYYLTTRALIKDSGGSATTITVNSGETLDVFYRIHKVITLGDRSFVVNMLDGSGGSVPYNAVVRPMQVGARNYNAVSEVVTAGGGYTNETYHSSEELGPETSQPAAVKSPQNTFSASTYVPGSHKRTLKISYGLNEANATIRTVATGHSLRTFPVQVRFGSVADDSPIVKTAKDTLLIPIEVSWGRYEGAL